MQIYNLLRGTNLSARLLNDPISFQNSAPSPLSQSCMRPPLSGRSCISSASGTWFTLYLLVLKSSMTRDLNPNPTSPRGKQILTAPYFPCRLAPMWRSQRRDFTEREVGLLFPRGQMKLTTRFRRMTMVNAVWEIHSKYKNPASLEPGFDCLLVQSWDPIYRVKSACPPPSIASHRMYTKSVYCKSCPYWPG